MNYQEELLKKAVVAQVLALAKNLELIDKAEKRQIAGESYIDKAKKLIKEKEDEVFRNLF